jgi:hypothetical protein
MPRCAHDGCQRWRPLWMAPRALSFDGDWFCGPGCLRDEAALRLRAFAPEPLVGGGATRFRLGTLLLASRAITTPVLERALERQRESGRVLGAELIAMGAVDVGTLTHALARQAGVPSVTGLLTTHVAAGVAGLSRRVVRALGVLPFEVDQKGWLRVAVTAPVPRTALRALERMTGRTVRPYMIGDATMSALLEGYGAMCPDAEDTVLLASPAEAAAHIAEAARAGRVAGWRCVPATSFTWVRLEGASGTDDLIVRGLGEGDAWQAAPTRH